MNSATYTASTNSGATETVTLGVNNNGSTDVAIKGSVTAGDTIIISATNAGSPTPVSTTYTVTSTDTLVSIASHIAAAINSNSSLQAMQISASSRSSGILLSSETFRTTPLLSGDKNTAAITGQDGGGNQTTNQFPLSTLNNASKNLTFDLNGNMTSDGTNSYQWDAENRLIQINYPGSGNNSQFTYDGNNRNVLTVEEVSSTVIKTNQFVWSQNERSESRDTSGALISQYFSLGTVISGTKYFYTKDHNLSTWQISDSTSTIQTQSEFDPYGTQTLLKGSLISDFQYDGYFYHSPSKLSLTLTRPYSAPLGKWLSRDPIQELGGSNMSAYVTNNPVGYRDPSGLNKHIDDLICIAKGLGAFGLLLAAMGLGAAFFGGIGFIVGGQTGMWVGIGIGLGVGGLGGLVGLGPALPHM